MHTKKNFGKEKIKDSVMDSEWLIEETQYLNSLERPQTFPAYCKVADHLCAMLESEGFSEVRRMDFPADGKTVFHDKRMPLAWNISKGRLTVRKSAVSFENPVVADYEKEPFSVIQHSVATPPEGILCKVVTETDMWAGAECRGAMILCEESTPPRPKILKAVLDRGALGLISSYMVGGKLTPEHVQWVVACAEYSNWHVQCEDRPFIGFSVSPVTGQELREAAGHGELLVLVESDGRRYEGILPAVTALIPGRRKEEIWLMAHLYEPMADDNAGGVIASIEVARKLARLSAEGEIPPLEFSIRVVFAMEVYGFSAVAAWFGDNLRSSTVAGIVMDGLTISRGTHACQAVYAPAAVPCFANLFCEDIFRLNQMEKFLSPCDKEIFGAYFDDMQLSDQTVGLPTVWFCEYNGTHWHSSRQNCEDWLVPEKFAEAAAVCATWVAWTATVSEKNLSAHLDRALVYAKQHLDGEAERIRQNLKTHSFRPGTSLREEVRERFAFRLKIETERILDFRRVADLPQIRTVAEELRTYAEPLLRDLEKTVGNEVVPGEMPLWFAYADEFVVKRTAPGFPFDAVNIPKEIRKPLPGGSIYGVFAHISSSMDGMKTLQRLFREAEWERRTETDEKNIRECIEGIRQIAAFNGGFAILKAGKKAPV